MTLPNIIVEHDVVIPLRDGTRTFADVYRFDDGERRPVIMQRAIYGKHSTHEMAYPSPMTVVRAGYVYVSQDCRGCWTSEGDWEFFFQEQADGYDSIEWVAQQPWSAGKVGLIGASGHGMTAYQALAAAPPSLAAAFIEVAAADMQSWSKRAGALSELHMGAGFAAAAVGLNNLARLDVDHDERARLSAALAEIMNATGQDLKRLPVLDFEAVKDDRLGGGIKDILLREPTDAFWQKDAISAGRSPGRVKVPVKAITGAFDVFVRSMTSVFASNPDLGHELIFGPWGHFGVYGQPYGVKNYKAAPGGGEVWTPLVLSWFDRWLKDDTPPAKDSSTAYYFLAGENRWATSPTWPPAGREQELYLTSPAGSASVGEQGAVVFERPAEPGSRGFTYDPGNPVPTIGGPVVDFMAATRFDPSYTADATQDQRRVEGRPDVLVYTSAELTEIVRMAGSASVKLWASSSAEDTDFFVRVIDVEPDGFAGNVTEGVVRTRYRNGANDSWLTPGEPTELKIELDPTAYSFLPGHRIRVHVTSSNFPRFSRNLNSRAVPEFGTQDDARIAEQHIYDGPAMPSRLIFNIVPETPAAFPYQVTSRPAPPMSSHVAGGSPPD